LHCLLEVELIQPTIWSRFPSHGYGAAVAYLNRLVLWGRKFHLEGLEGNGRKKKEPGKEREPRERDIRRRRVLGIKVWSDWLTD
jgi:hypothetical protein